MQYANSERRFRVRAGRAPECTRAKCYDRKYVGPEATEPSAPPKRTCANCNATVPVVEGSWAFKPGGDPLKICAACWQARKAESHGRRAQATTAKPKPKPTAPEDIKAITAERKLDVAKALKVGAQITNDHAEMVMARVLQYANDPEHKHHLWAVQLLAERILPRKLYEELGAAAAGVGSLNDKRPQFIIQVLPATPEAPVGRLIEGTAEAVTVEALPAPKQ